MKRIMIFEEDSRTRRKIREHFKKFKIGNIIVINFEQFCFDFYEACRRNEEMEVLNLVAKNKMKLPIIFYGDKEHDNSSDNYLEIIKDFGLYGRKDMALIENVFNVKLVKYVKRGLMSI